MAMMMASMMVATLLRLLALILVVLRDDDADDGGSGIGGRASRWLARHWLKILFFGTCPALLLFFMDRDDFSGYDVDRTIIHS